MVGKRNLLSRGNGIAWTCVSVTIVACIGAYSLAWASDEVGIYFDEAGTISSLTVNDTSEYVSAWVVIKDMTSPLSAAIIDGEIEGPVIYYCWVSLIGSYSFDCMLPWATEHGLPAIEPQASLPIIHMEFRVASLDTPVRLFIRPFQDPFYPPMYNPPGWETSGQYIALTPVSGSYDIPVAVVNGVVANERSSWGAVKQLYR